MVSGLDGSLVLDGFWSLEAAPASLAGATVGRTSGSDGVLLGILDLVPSEPGELWSFVVVAETRAPSVGTVALAVVEDVVLAPSLVVRLAEAVWPDSGLPEPVTCGLGLSMSEVAPSEHSESVRSLTTAPRSPVSPVSLVSLVSLGACWSVVDGDLRSGSWSPTWW